MKDENNFEADSIENDIADVEHLLKSMSLKSAPESLDRSIKRSVDRGGTKFMHSWAGLLSLATASMLAGLLLGRFVVPHGIPISRSSVESDRVGESVATRNSTKGQLVQSSENDADETSLDDRGLFFVNGTIPVRKYVAHSKQQFEVVDSKLGTKTSVSIPVRKTIFAPAPGI